MNVPAMTESPEGGRHDIERTSRLRHLRGRRRGTCRCFDRRCFDCLGFVHSGLDHGCRRAGGDRPTSAQTLVEAYNASGVALFVQFAASPGNIVFSPYSIGTAMAMALSGARGDTATEMAKVLRQRLSRQPQIDAANSAVRALLNGYDKSALPLTCPKACSSTARTAKAPPRGRRLHVGLPGDGERCIAPSAGRPRRRSRPPTP